MAMTMHVDIATAEAEIYSGPVTMLVARAENGEVGILPRHAPMLARLQPGEVRVTLQNGDTESFFVSGGMLEVQPRGVTILSDTGARAQDLDEAQALEAKRNAEEAIADRQSDFEYAKAQVELAEAVAQLRTIESLRKRVR